MKGTVVPSLCSLITRHLQSVWDWKQLFLYLPGSPGRAAQALLQWSPGSLQGCSLCLIPPCLSSLPPTARGESWGKSKSVYLMYQGLPQLCYTLNEKTHLKNTLTTGEDVANASPFTKAANTGCCCGATSAPRMCCLVTSSWKLRHPQGPSPESHLSSRLCIAPESPAGKYKPPLCGQGQPTAAQQLQNKASSERSTWMWQQSLLYRDTTFFPFHLIICI